MKRRLLLILNILIVSVYTCSVCGCTNKDSEIGSEGIAINSDGTPIEESDASGFASSQEEELQDPYEYLTPAMEILSWKCVNDVAAGKAIDLINEALEIDDGLADAYKARGSAYLCLGDSIANFDSAEADFIKLQELEPNNPDGYLGQAEILIRKGKVEEAIELLAKAKELTLANSSKSDKDSSSEDSSSEGSSQNIDADTSASSDSDESSSSDEANSSDGSSSSDEANSSDGSSSSDEANSSDEASSSDEDQSQDENNDGGSSSESQARYNSGIPQLFMTSEDEIQARIDELSSDTYSDSTGRVRYKTLYSEDGTAMESIFYACYFYGEEEANIIVTYNTEGTMLATVFNLYEDTDRYVYGMYTGSDTWNICVPLWSEDGVMTGIQTYYGGSVLAYEIYLYDSEGTMIGSEQYNSSKTLENTVYFDGYSSEDAVNATGEVVGTATYTLEDIYALLAQFVQ